jgi:hypothetical protein
MVKQKRIDVDADADDVEESRVLYPVNIQPALARIKSIAATASWLSRKEELAHSVWQLCGATQALFIGSPDRDAVEVPSLEVIEQTRNILHECLRGIRSSSLAQSRQALPASGDSTRIDVGTIDCSRVLELVIVNGVQVFSYMKKIALTRASQVEKNSARGRLLETAKAEKLAAEREAEASALKAVAARRAAEFTAREEQAALAVE